MTSRTRRNYLTRPARLLLHLAQLPWVDGCSAPMTAQKRASPVYLESPHLSVAEIEPPYLIYTL